MSSASFYDNYLKQQALSGINDRIYLLYKRALQHGLNTNSNVLEIGCGIGTLTYLLAQKVKQGRIEAMDLSPASIEFARRYITKENIEIYPGDIIEKDPLLPAYDLILLFDVLEHILVEKHGTLFKRIASRMDDKSLLLINIPNPGYILYDQQHNSSVLQELDQALEQNVLVKNFANAGLEIQQFNTYSVWVKNDYQFMVIRKQQPFREEVLSEKRGLFAKGRTWLWRRWRKLRYPYPPKGSY